jgi:hypothetical protein
MWRATDADVANEPPATEDADVVSDKLEMPPPADALR